MKMNIAWHTTHPMPRRATMSQRIRWHREHAEHCACRPVPEAVVVAMQARDGRRTGTAEDKQREARA